MSEGYKDLIVFKKAYKLAGKIFLLSKAFPVEERYSLTDQIRRSSRSVCVNIAEGYRKRIYPNHFRSKMSDADAECSETIVWLDFALECRYITMEQHNMLINQYNEVGKMLGAMIKHPDKFVPE
ncbi:MAG: four helix bundle protein [Balneolaceae bacterium]|nr:four helix bundle protein [Balneolaceae bacterium]